MNRLGPRAPLTLYFLPASSRPAFFVVAFGPGPSPLGCASCARLPRVPRPFPWLSPPEGPTIGLSPDPPPKRAQYGLMAAPPPPKKAQHGPTAARSPPPPSGERFSGGFAPLPQRKPFFPRPSGDRKIPDRGRFLGQFSGPFFLARKTQGFSFKVIGPIHRPDHYMVADLFSILRPPPPCDLQFFFPFHLSVESRSCPPPPPEPGLGWRAWAVGAVPPRPCPSSVMTAKSLYVSTSSSPISSDVIREIMAVYHCSLYIYRVIITFLWVPFLSNMAIRLRAADLDHEGVCELQRTTSYQVTSKLERPFKH